MSASKFLSTSSVAARWDCSPDLVRKLVREGVIKAIALTSGKRTFYRISIAAVEQYESGQMLRRRECRAAISPRAIKFSEGG